MQYSKFVSIPHIMLDHSLLYLPSNIAISSIECCCDLLFIRAVMSSWYRWAVCSNNCTRRAQVLAYSHRPIVDNCKEDNIN